MGTEAQLESRVRAAIAKNFNLNAAEAAGDLRMGSLPQWDSLAHMDLVVALEHEFKVTFPSYALSDLVNVPAIVRHLNGLGAG